MSEVKRLFSFVIAPIKTLQCVQSAQGQKIALRYTFKIQDSRGLLWSDFFKSVAKFKSTETF